MQHGRAGNDADDAIQVDLQNNPETTLCAIIHGIIDEENNFDRTVYLQHAEGGSLLAHLLSIISSRPTADVTIFENASLSTTPATSLGHDTDTPTWAWKKLFGNIFGNNIFGNTR